MFVVGKEAKIRSLFVMPRAKTSGEKDGALHKIASCSISIQGGPQGWTWMRWFITMYPKIFTFLSIQWGVKHVFRIDRSLHLKLLKTWSLSKIQILALFWVCTRTLQLLNSTLLLYLPWIWRYFWLNWLLIDRNYQFGLFCPFLQVSLPSVGSHLLSAP